MGVCSYFLLGWRTYSMGMAMDMDLLAFPT